jgi:hypothetical protein
MTDTGGYGTNDHADEPAPQPGAAEPTADTPDPYGTANDSAYVPGDGTGVDVPVQFLPPWALTRAPGTVRTVAPVQIVPVDPWAPGYALLDAQQLALVNRESAVRQAAAMYTDDPRNV